MPGILLLPGGLNEKVIEKITADELWQRRDRPVLNSLAPRRARTQDPRVLVCHDGFGKNSERDAKWQTTFQKRLLGEKTDVREKIPRVAALPDGQGDSSTTYVKKSGACVNQSETEALQFNLDLSVLYSQDSMTCLLYTSDAADE